ncbi:hypothetical protein COY28_06090 [Candidatus Woesearchaeota archaeon CG_4_10_14_0_2_um_filter_57_5]|nr:MAG: hypothetical protein COY28_06090 [Candidatus Woesearchaeota archaeon CG_4_10_14_0_2_um_filter_57_5]
MGRKKRCIRLRLGRRAVIEVQFNWIFILIVGGLLMGFFFSIINKQKQAADMRLAQDTLAQIELIVAGARASKNLAGIIEPIPPLGITLSCDPTGVWAR